MSRVRRSPEGFDPIPCDEGGGWLQPSLAVRFEPSCLPGVDLYRESTCWRSSFFLPWLTKHDGGVKENKITGLKFISNC